MGQAAFEARRDSSLAAMRQASAALRGRRPRPPQPSWAPYGTSAMAPPRVPRPAGQPGPRRAGADGGPAEEDGD